MDSEQHEQQSMSCTSTASGSTASYSSPSYSASTTVDNDDDDHYHEKSPPWKSNMFMQGDDDVLNWQPDNATNKMAALSFEDINVDSPSYKAFEQRVRVASTPQRLDDSIFKATNRKSTKNHSSKSTTDHSSDSSSKKKQLLKKSSKKRTLSDATTNAEPPKKSSKKIPSDSNQGKGRKSLGTNKDTIAVSKKRWRPPKTQKDVSEPKKKKQQLDKTNKRAAKANKIKAAAARKIVNEVCGGTQTQEMLKKLPPSHGRRNILPLSPHFSQDENEEASKSTDSSLPTIPPPTPVRSRVQNLLACALSRIQPICCDKKNGGRHQKKSYTVNEPIMIVVPVLACIWRSPNTQYYFNLSSKFASYYSQ